MIVAPRAPEPTVRTSRPTHRPTSAAVGARDRITVLCYHRIARPGDRGFAGDPALISATPEAFERQMRLVRRWFQPVALDDVVASVVDGRPLPRRAALVTFDDGYLDNFTEAYPVLRRVGVPAVVFLMTSFMGTGRRPWWDSLHHLLAATRSPSAELPGVGTMPLGTAQERRRAIREMSESVKARPADEIPEVLAATAAALGVEPEAEGPRLFMDWDEVRSMAAHGVSFQPHTHTHPLLSRIDEEQVRAEVSESARVIAEQLGAHPVAFAYPNGRPQDYGESARRALREAGIPIAFSTTPRTARLTAVRRAPLDIPRISIYRRDESARFIVKASGLGPLAERLARR